MTFPIVPISRLRFSNAHPTHNNLVKSRSFFFLTCRLRGIESRPNERGDKALCNNVLSIWTEKRGVFVIVYSSRVSLRDYSPNWRVAMFFFVRWKNYARERWMFVKFIINWYRKWCYTYFIWNWICCSCFCHAR